MFLFTWYIFSLSLFSLLAHIFSPCIFFCSACRRIRTVGIRVKSSLPYRLAIHAKSSDRDLNPALCVRSALVYPLAYRMKTRLPGLEPGIQGSRPCAIPFGDSPSTAHGRVRTADIPVKGRLPYHLATCAKSIMPELNRLNQICSLFPHRMDYDA